MDQRHEKIFQQEYLVVGELVQVALLLKGFGLVLISLGADEPENLCLLSICHDLEPGIGESGQSVGLVCEDFDRLVAIVDD